MEWLLIPISMLIKNFSFSLPGAIGTIPIYVFAFMFMLKWYQRSELLDVIVINKRVLLGVIAFGISQLVMIFYSYGLTNRPQDTSGLTTGPVNVFLSIGTLFLVYYLVDLLLVSDKQIKNFVRATLLTYVVFSIFILLPQMIATHSDVLDSWVNFWGQHFEAQHLGRSDFYKRGSYATTQRRVNGFSQEASFLAAMVGIIFLPFIMAAIKNHFDFFSGRRYRRQPLYWSALVFGVLVLFFARTSTGFLVIGVAVISMIIFASKQDRQFYLKLAAIAGIVFVILFLVNPTVKGLLNQYLFKKQGTSNRLGGTIALFSTFIHYPLFGVGRGYTSYYSFLYVPHSTIVNYEYFQTFVRTGYPDQSVWGEIFASYGLITVVPVGLFIYHKINKLRVAMVSVGAMLNARQAFYKTLLDSFVFSLIMFSVLGIFNFSWNDYIYYVIFFFYIVVINRVSSEIKQKGKLD